MEGNNYMKKLVFILVLFIFSVSLLADNVIPGRDSCRLSAKLDGNYTITTPTGQIITSHIASTVTDVIVMESVINETITVPFTGSVPLAGEVTGTFTGVLSANVIDPVTGAIAGTFTGIGTGITPSGVPVTGSVFADVTGKVKCKDDFQSEPCGVTLDCPSDVEYLYDFCIDGEIIQHNTILLLKNHPVCAVTQPPGTGGKSFPPQRGSNYKVIDGEVLCCI